MPWGCENFLSTRLLHQQPLPFLPLLLQDDTALCLVTNQNPIYYGPDILLACLLFLKDENGNAIIQLFEGVLCEFILKVSVLYYTVYHHIT